MPRPALILVLLSVWLFAIFAPPLISIFCDDRNPIVSINLNEEEQQEQGKKSTDELAVMIDTFKPLMMTNEALKIDDGVYYQSWLGEG